MAKKTMTEEEKAAFAEKAKKAAERKERAAAATAKAAEADTKNEEIVAPAEEVVGIAEDGTETPLIELEPALAGEKVIAPAEEEKAAESASVADKTYSEKDVERMIAEATAKAVAEAMAKMQAQQPQVQTIIREVGADKEKVLFLWQAPVSDDNVVLFGDGGMYGHIEGKTGSFYVPKSELSRVLTEVNRVYLRRRWLVIVSGLNEEEREALGVNYGEGELLDKKAFMDIVGYGDQILSVYPSLCEGHKKMVAQFYTEEYEGGNADITRDRVVKLNEMSKRVGSERGDFIHIIEWMNAKETA